jgi:TP901 family phage tail tape measure protein
MMPSIGGFSISVTANTAGLNKGFKKARGLTRGFAGGIGKLAGGMAAIGAPLAGIAGIAKLIRVGSEFQSEMSNVKAFVKGTESELQKLSDTAEGLGASTAFTASDAAKAMAEMGKAGLSANQILGASEGVLTLAAAGDIEMAEAATIAAASLNQFGIPASQMGSVVDQLAKAASSGSISLSGMGTQLSYAAASASAFGMDLGETSGIISTLATTLGEDKAGTAFRSMMTSLQAPTAGAAAQLESLGISLTDSAGNFLQLPAIVEQFNGALAGMATGEKSAAMSKIFNVRGIGAFSALMKQGAAGMREVTESVADSDGFGLAVADEKLDNVAGGFKRLQSAVMAMSIDIFQTFEGPLQSALEGTASFVTDTMIPGWKTMMEWVSAFAKVAEFAWTSFGALAGLATLKALSAVTTLSEDIQHFFGTNMAEVFNWLFSNWSSIWVDMAAVTFGVLDNIGQNVRNVFSAVWETVTSLGETPLTFDMVPLMDGVQTVTAGLELTERAMTADERDYQREIAEVGNAIGQDFDDFLTSTVDGIGSTTVAADDVMDDVANADFNADKSAVSTKDGESPLGVALRGSKEAFDVINKAIRGEKDAYQKTIAKEAEKQTKLAEQQVALLEDNNSIEPAAVMSIP